MVRKVIYKYNFKMQWNFDFHRLIQRTNKCILVPKEEAVEHPTNSFVGAHAPTA
jgi:hypothetical protein